MIIMTKLDTCLRGNLNSDYDMVSHNKAAKIQSATTNTEKSDNAEMNTVEVATKPLPSDASAKDKTKLSDNSDANPMKATTKSQLTS